MAEGWRRQGFTGKIKLLLFSLIPAVLLLTCGEVFATLTIARDVSLVRDSTTGESVYSMRIGKLPWSRRSVTRLNTMGFPDREFPPAAPRDGCVHVVFAGDSYIFGDGVDRDSSFVSLVRQWATARITDRCIRIFNIAERGTTIDRQAQQVRETFDRLEPDVVILGQYQNDLTDLTNPWFNADSVRAREQERGVRRVTTVRERWKIFNANLLRLLSYHAFAFMIRRDIEYDVLSRWSVLADSSQLANANRLMGIYEASFAALAADLAGRGIPLGVVIVPSKLDVMAGRYPEEAFFLRLAARHDVPALRVFPILDSNRTPYPFLMYDGHFNELGNRVVAKALYTWLFEAEPAPFAPLRVKGSP